MQFVFIKSKTVGVKYTITIAESPTLIEVGQFKSQTIIRYRLIDSPGTEFEINATANGVRILGGTPLLTNQDQLDEFHRVIQWAFRQHESLKVDGHSIDQEELNLEVLS